MMKQKAKVCPHRGDTIVNFVGMSQRYPRLCVRVDRFARIK